MNCDLDNILSIKNPCDKNYTKTSYFDVSDIYGFSWGRIESITPSVFGSAYNTLLSERKKAYDSLLQEIKLSLNKKSYSFQSIAKTEITGAIINNQSYYNIAQRKGICIKNILRSKLSKLKINTISVKPAPTVTFIEITIVSYLEGVARYTNILQTANVGLVNIVNLASYNIISDTEIVIYWTNATNVNESEIKNTCGACLARGNTGSKKNIETKNVTVTAVNLGGVEYTENKTLASYGNGISANVSTFCDYENFVCDFNIADTFSSLMLKQMQLQLISLRAKSSNINYFTITQDFKERNYESETLKAEIKERCMEIATQIVTNGIEICDCVKSTGFKTVMR